MAESVDLPVNCVHCGQGVSLKVEDWNTRPYQQATWICPYLDCQKINGIGMSGRLIKATAYYGCDQPARQ
jgi:hypothetical protein